MELIDIISTILFFGGGLLILVVLISFFSSKMRGDNQELYRKNKRQSQASKNIIRPFKSSAPRLPGNTGDQIPQIFQLEQIRPREIKMIRKPTVRETSTEETAKSKEQQNANGEKNRYTIVNEEQKKIRGQVVNYR